MNKKLTAVRFVIVGVLFLVGLFFVGRAVFTGSSADARDANKLRVVEPVNQIGPWEETTFLPAGLSNHAAVAYNNYLYAIGGSGGIIGETTSTIFYSSIKPTGGVNSWLITTQLPFAIRENSVVAYNNYLYSIGGRATDGFMSSVFYAPININGSLGPWTMTTALPGVNGFGAAVVNNGHVYMIGGRNGFVSTSTVFYAEVNTDGTIGSWVTTTVLPTQLYWHDAVVSNGYVYVIGGKTETAVISSVFYAPINANGSLGSWSTTTALPFRVFRHQAVVNSGHIYVMGGVEEGNSSGTTAVRWAPISATGSLGSWSTTTALPSAIYSQGVAVYNGFIYSTGGVVNSITNPISSVFYSQISKDLSQPAY